MKLTIKEIADLKEGRKTLEEITKTHDGTSMGKLRFSLNIFAESYRGYDHEEGDILDEEGNLIQHVQGDKDSIQISLKMFKENNITNVHVTHNHPYAMGEGSIVLKNIPTCLSDRDMKSLLKKNDDGDYYLRGITAESPNGWRMTLIKNNKFNEDDEKEFEHLYYKLHHTVNEYRTFYKNSMYKNLEKEKEKYLKQHPHSDLSTREIEEIIYSNAEKTFFNTQIGTMKNYLKVTGMMDEFKKHNCRLIVEKGGKIGI